MTVYEQIQNAIDYIESNLFKQLTCDEVAKNANMSLRSFYNYFWEISGYRYKEYVRKRRLSEALLQLQATEEKIIKIALQTGYESHEAFSRAFSNEFGLSPIRFRKSRQNLKRIEKIKIIEEMYMGIIVKEIPEMKVVSFIGFSPEPENKAHTRIQKWANENGYGELYGDENNKPHRNFGHDTDASGKGYSHNGNMENYGYKVMITVDESTSEIDSDLNIETFQSGKFVVTGVEGDIQKNWRFIPKGWEKLNKMVKEKGYRIKSDGRCFEEKLEPSRHNLLRLDLYMEIES